ncbi:PleD family two-component system response regulator [Phenylobacterium sp. J367]|uniref:response regulator n=1 Tax=Phenylobacterium sp. J367 TaxID=2898435 RepID=UPI002150943A|nr:response regulator [Phenylobacterium sp. J367]MCR5878188.1 response regulator [Phenylobacterium sp. J367]
MALDPASRSRYNLEDASVLLLDDTTLGMSILVQIVTGLGAKKLYRCTDVDAAKEVAQRHELDLAIVDGMSPSGDGYDFVKWMRTNCQEPNCYTPVIITTAHTPATDVARARDCGGHIIVKKPFAPIVMLERIIWVAKEGRPFLFSGEYVGPDRRFRDDGPPKGVGRRREDNAANAQPIPAEADEVKESRLAS